MAAPPLPSMQASRLDWAQYYAELGWPVFPCRGKVPLTPKGFKDATTDPFEIAVWWQQDPHANIGCPAGLQWWALDVDPRAGGDSTLADLQRQYGVLPDTLLSHTGGGGQHYLWALPQHGAILNKAHIGQGLDVQGEGSYIIVPPSLHPDTQLTYIWDVLYGPDDLAPQAAPDWLVTLVASTTPRRSPRPTQTTPPPPGGGAIPLYTRNTTLFQYAIAMAHAGCGANAIRAALEIENQRCVPPLDADEVTRIAHSAAHYQRPSLTPSPPLGWAAALNGSPRAAAPPQGGPPPPLPNWRQYLATKKSGGLVQDVRNIELILEHHDFYRDHLWWDEVRLCPMFGETPIDDDTIVRIATWLGTEESMSVTNLRMVERCVLARCRTRPHDVIQAWLHALPPWDQTVRLPVWLTDCAGVDPTAYGQDVSRLLILGMVARAMDPGCICRHVVILEGPEECGKSTLVQALAGDDWYVILSLGLESKDSHMMLQGVWVAELAELDSLGRTEETRLKAFITMRQDSYIPKYSNFRQSHPRRAVFVGTTNEESYLKGQTGNTRFLPVKVTQQIDIDGFRAIRDQLFAEALTLYHSGLPWWHMSPEGAETAKEEREKRRIVNVYEDSLREWLDVERFTHTYVDHYNHPVTFTANETSWKEIAQYYLGLKTPAEWENRSRQMQIAAALKGIGWHLNIVKRHNKTTRIWVK